MIIVGVQNKYKFYQQVEAAIYVNISLLRDDAYQNQGQTFKVVTDENAL